MTIFKLATRGGKYSVECVKHGEYLDVIEYVNGRSQAEHLNLPATRVGLNEALASVIQYARMDNINYKVVEFSPQLVPVPA